MSNQNTLSIGQQVYGYTIEKHVGAGAFANVYLASKTNASGKHTIALKHIVLPNEEDYNDVLRSMNGEIERTDEHFKKLFENIILEINTFKKLSLKSNNHIITYYDNDVEYQENPLRYDVFIKMEYATPLTKPEEERQLSVNELLKMCEHILFALKVCHEANVIHRDIKDDNLFINNDGMYKIADFGVSTLLKKSERAKTQKGTPAFIAPEIMNNAQETYDHTVDLYSLGIVLYKFFNSNRLPLLPPAPESFTMDDVSEAVARRLNGEEIPPPSKGSKEVGEFILKAIAPRENRYNCADEMLEALKKVKESLTDEQLEEVVLTLNVMQVIPRRQTVPESVESIHQGIDLFNPSESKNEEINNKVANLSQPEEKDLGQFGETKGVQPAFVQEEAVTETNQNLFNTNKHRLINSDNRTEQLENRTAQSESYVHTGVQPQVVSAINEQSDSNSTATPDSPVRRAVTSASSQTFTVHDTNKDKKVYWIYGGSIATVILLICLLFIDVFVFIESIPVVSTVFNRYIILGILLVVLTVLLFGVGNKLNKPKYNESLYVAYKGNEATEEVRLILSLLKMSKDSSHVNQEELATVIKMTTKLIDKLSYAGDFGLKNPKVYPVEGEIAQEIDNLKVLVEIFGSEGKNKYPITATINKISLLVDKRKTLLVR